jgi:flagellar hook-associated protein 2
MTTISSAGIGSGLDVASLVSKLMAVEQAPIMALNKKEASFQAKLSTYGTLKSSMAALQTSAKAIATASVLTPVKAGVADATILGAAVGTNAVAGTYDIAVLQLAQSQKLKTDTGYAATTSLVGEGTLTFSFGTYAITGAPPAWTPDASRSFPAITTGASTTLADLRDQINAGNMGVSASIINDGTKNYLTLTSSSTGVASAMKIDVSGDTSGDLTALMAYDGSSTAPGSGKMGQIVAAQDAKIIVDSVQITKSSNTITDAIEGVTLNLTKPTLATTDVNGTTYATTKVTLTRDTSSVQAAVQAFVKAYNETSAAMKDATSFDATTGKAATLNGDSTIRSFQIQLRNIFSVPVAGAPTGMAVLSDVGITFQKDGTLAIDAAKFNAANTDPGKDLSKLFSTTDNSKGYGYQMDVLIGSLLSPVGQLIGQTNSVSKSIKSIGTQRDTVTARLVDVEKRYRAQFTALDTLVASLTTTSNFLTQQLAAITANA